METVVRALMLTAALLAGAAAVAGTVYKSTAPDGSVVYSDHPPANGKVDKTISFDDLPSSPVPPPVQRPQSGAGSQVTHPPAARPPPQNASVVLYVASWCPYCRRAKAWLAQRRIPYEEIDVESEVGSVEFQVAARGGGIPYLVSGARHIRGFEDAGYAAFFAGR